MTKESAYSPAALKRAEDRRQRVLDYLWAHGNTTFAVIFAAMNEAAASEGRAEYPMAAMRGTMASMLQRGELAAYGPQKMLIFVPLVKTTEPAESMRERKLARNRKHATSNPRDRRSEATKAKHAELDREEVRKLNVKEHAKKHEPWKTIHFAGDTPQAPDSHGQGALRERVTVNCAQSIFY